MQHLHQDLPGSIHEDTVMDDHRQGEKANAYKYPLAFLKWWSSLVLKTFTCASMQSTVIGKRRQIVGAGLSTWHMPYGTTGSVATHANIDIIIYLFKWITKLLFDRDEKNSKLQEVTTGWLHSECSQVDSVEAKQILLRIRFLCYGYFI